MLIDADDGRFKEASWVKDPVKYLPISREDAQRMVFETIKKTDIGRRTTGKVLIELVHRDSTPYYPDWKITLKNQIFYVSQDGTVSCDM